MTVEAVVNTDGSVGDVRVLRTFSPSYGLDAEAVRAVKQWRLRPAAGADARLRCTSRLNSRSAYGE